MEILKSPVRYVCLESLCKSEDLGEYITYGIALAGAGAPYIKDVSLDKNSVEALAEKLTRRELSPIHLMDAIEDFLGT